MFRESLQRTTQQRFARFKLTLTNGAGARVGARVFFIGSIGEGFNLVKDAQTERKRGRNYSKSRQECLEGIFDDSEELKSVILTSGPPGGHSLSVNNVPV